MRWRSATSIGRSIVRLAVAMVGLGCFAHRAASELRPESPVRVEFVDPTTLVVIGAPGDSLWLRDITALWGRVQRITSDTLYVQVTGASTFAGVNHRVHPDRLATVARRSGVLVEGRELQPFRTGGLITAILAVVGLAILVATFEPPG